MSLINDLSNYQRLFPAFKHSWQGLKTTFNSELPFRQEVMASLVMIPLGLILGDTGVEKGLLIASWLLILIVELLNTAVEFVVDRISEDHHELSGHAKDCGSAAVLMAIILAAIVWISIIVF